MLNTSKPHNLIQTVRAVLALMESGQSIYVPPESAHIYDYLEQYFVVNRAEYPTKLDLEINHKEPYVLTNGRKYPLLFPHRMTDYCRAMWKPIEYEFFFRGFTTITREPLLEQWRGRATIEETNGGRIGSKRHWDVEYMSKLGKSSFVLCPQGSLKWTYRFFEAILCGATPIVTADHPIYEGYYYHHWNDYTFYNKYQEENFELAKRQLTI